jgi:hypothetical protein
MKRLSTLAAGTLVLLVLCSCNRSSTGLAGQASKTTIDCANHLRLIAKYKDAWAAQTHAASNATPTWDDLGPYFPHGQPACPEGGTYTIGAVSELPKCSIPAHNEYLQAELKAASAPPTQ